MKIGTIVSNGSTVARVKVRGTQATGVPMAFGRSKHEALIDMFTNLMHANIGFENALETARMHYNAERKEGGKRS